MEIYQPWWATGGSQGCRSPSIVGRKGPVWAPLRQCTSLCVALAQYNQVVRAVVLMVEVLMVGFNYQSSSPDNLMLLTRAECREVHRRRGPRTASHSQLQVYLLACLPDIETTEVRSPLTALPCVPCRSRSVFREPM